jgi:RNA polymerase sigma-70 factor (ECF subfamily)
MRLEFDTLIHRYQDSVYHAAFSICKNAQDAEDVTQDTFIAYYNSKQDFQSEEHIRAWLLRVAINKGKDLLRSFWRRNRLSWEEYVDTLTFEHPEDGDLFRTVMDLPEKYRVVIHLHYYEDYAVKEIAKILRVSENTVKVRLHRGRILLKEKLGGMNL